MTEQQALTSAYLDDVQRKAREAVLSWQPEQECRHCGSDWHDSDDCKTPTPTPERPHPIDALIAFATARGAWEMVEHDKCEYDTWLIPCSPIESKCRFHKAEARLRKAIAEVVK